VRTPFLGIQNFCVPEQLNIQSHLSWTPDTTDSQWILQRTMFSDGGLFNYVKIDADMKLRKIKGYWLITEIPGYVFNISEHLWQADWSYKMTMGRVQAFLLSLLGEPGAVDDFDVACKEFLMCHYVRIFDDKKCECDNCFAFKKWTECGHVLAAKHLESGIDILELLQMLHLSTNYSPCCLCRRAARIS
jgi:hypothetical protein